MENYELYHAGVKGMKWGVRKAKPQTSSGKTKGSSKQDESIKRTKRLVVGTYLAGIAVGALGGMSIQRIRDSKYVTRGKVFTGMWDSRIKSKYGVSL